MGAGNADGGPDLAARVERDPPVRVVAAVEEVSRAQVRVAPGLSSRQASMFSPWLFHSFLAGSPERLGDDGASGPAAIAHEMATECLDGACLAGQVGGPGAGQVGVAYGAQERGRAGRAAPVPVVPAHVAGERELVTRFADFKDGQGALAGGQGAQDRAERDGGGLLADEVRIWPKIKSFGFFGAGACSSSRSPRRCRGGDFSWLLPGRVRAVSIAEPFCCARVRTGLAGRPGCGTVTFAAASGRGQRRR